MPDTSSFDMQRSGSGHLVGSFAIDRDLVMYRNKDTNKVFWQLQGTNIVIYKMTFKGKEFQPYSNWSLDKLRTELSKADPEASVYSIPRVYIKIEFELASSGPKE